jgi:histidyl-tRNA synthetase
MAKKVKARLSRGLRDLLPEEMIQRQQMIDTVRGVCERYGFSPIETPAVEYLEVLLGAAGEETQQGLFSVTNPEEEALGLRFDLTVPLSRVVSQHDVELPFRRYQVSPVWRADKPGPGRFRQFTQFDIDSVGAPSEVADVEIMAAMCDTLEALEVGGYIVRFSSRKILNLLLIYAGVTEEQGTEVFRVLDKIDKMGLEKAKLELSGGYTDESGASIRGLGLGATQIERIESFLGTAGETRDAVIRKLRKLFADVEGAEAEIAEVQSISNHLGALGYDSDRVMLDLSIARGLAYYTGPVFEANLTDAPQFGSIFAGGRYDNLVARFGGPPVPATGASMGVDRLLAALTHLGRVQTAKTTAQVLVTTMDGSLTGDYLLLTQELRCAGIRTEVHVGRPKKLGKQLQRADRLEIPYVIIMGVDEVARNVVTVKEMDVGRQEAESVSGHEEWKQARFGQQEVARDKLVETLKGLLGV